MTGEMGFGMTNVSLMGDISTTLDSAATYDTIYTQRTIAKTLHKAVTISLIQPTPEVFALFDNILILNEGELMQVVPYFELLEFDRPPGHDITTYWIWALTCSTNTRQLSQSG